MRNEDFAIYITFNPCQFFHWTVPLNALCSVKKRIYKKPTLFKQPARHLKLNYQIFDIKLMRLTFMYRTFIHQYISKYSIFKMSVESVLYV